MQLSRFNVWVKDYPQENEWLVFNTRTQALIKIKPELKSTLDSLAHVNPVSLSAFTQGCLAALKDSGIIVEDAQEEAAKLEDFFRQLKFESLGMPFEATILTTYACNFKCVYCFEKSVKNDVFLDGATSSQIVKWLIKRAQVRGFKRIYLVYYGGEPLMNIKPIYDISWHLKNWAEEKGVEFGFGIITNGSLLSASLVDKFLTVGLKDIRVSVDGYKEAHDKKRPFADGRPSFDLIIGNIKSIIDKTKVGIAGNFDLENYPGIPRFLDYLEEEGILGKLAKIDFTPLVPRLGPKQNPGAIELGNCLSYVSKDGLFNEVLVLKRELIRRGIDVPTGLAINACSLIMQDGGITIDPEGAIYKCNALVGYPEFAIGSVAEEALNGKFQGFFNTDAWNKCPHDCPYVPMCQGGCRFFSYLENNNFTDLACKRGYFDHITPELIKLEYEKLHAAHEPAGSLS